jgi:hypothetical protein
MGWRRVKAMSEARGLCVPRLTRSRGQQIMGGAPLALPLPEPSEAHGGAQLQGFGC